MKPAQFVFLCAVVKAMTVVLRIGQFVALAGIGYAWYLGKNDLFFVVIGLTMSLLHELLWRKPIREFLSGKTGEPPRLWKIGQSEPFIFVILSLTIFYAGQNLFLWVSIKHAFG